LIKNKKKRSNIATARTEEIPKESQFAYKTKTKLLTLIPQKVFF
jgi:hypothetical protein